MDEKVSAFLETISSTTRLQLLRQMGGQVTKEQLFLMATSADFSLPEGDVDTQLAALKEYLMTKERYEGGRLR